MFKKKIHCSNEKKIGLQTEFVGTSTQFIFISWKRQFASSFDSMEKTISKYSNRGLERLARAVRVLSSNTKWRLSSSYTVIECHDKEEAVTWLGKEFNLFKNRAMYLGSTICEMCFQEGRLNYEACHLHTNCTHHFYNETCIACTSTTLAGYWYERLKTLQDKNILEVIEESRESVRVRV